MDSDSDDDAASWCGIGGLDIFTEHYRYPFIDGVKATRKEVTKNLMIYFENLMAHLTHIYHKITAPPYEVTMRSSTHDVYKFVDMFGDVLNDFAKISEMVGCGDQRLCNHVIANNRSADEGGTNQIYWHLFNGSVSTTAVEAPTVQTYWPKDATNDQKVMWCLHADLRYVLVVLRVLEYKVRSRQGRSARANIPNMCCDLMHAYYAVYDVLGDICSKLNRLNHTRHISERFIPIKMVPRLPTGSGGNDLPIEQQHQPVEEIDRFECGSDASHNKIRREMTRDIDNLGEMICMLDNKMNTARWKVTTTDYELDQTIEFARTAFATINVDFNRIQQAFWRDPDSPV